MVRTLPVAAWHSMPAYDMIHTLRGLCRREVESLCDFLEGLATIDQKGIHLELGFPNLFELCRIEFGLSEGCIYRRIQVARKLRHYPELLRALRSGDINLTLASMLCPYLGRHAWETLLSCVRGQSKRQACKALRDLDQQVKTPDGPTSRVQYLGGERYSYRLRIPSHLHHQLERVRELLSHQVPEGEWTGILETLVQYYLRKNDPHEQISPSPDLWLEYSSTSRYIPKGLKQLLLERSGFQCQYISAEGRRCSQTRYLDIDHIHPLARGGETRMDNLQVLCRAHNLLKGDTAITHHNQFSTREKKEKPAKETFSQKFQKITKG
jgi:5-methylcytosine-specific restriction endonuclease McrA